MKIKLPNHGYDRLQGLLSDYAEACRTFSPRYTRRIELALLSYHTGLFAEVLAENDMYQLEPAQLWRLVEQKWRDEQ